MKRYRIYRNIRERAMIFGLAVNGFAIQMTAVIIGLLIIIFSFSLVLIFLVVALNIFLYAFLLRFKGFEFRASSKNISLISNKEIGISSYEN